MEELASARFADDDTAAPDFAGTFRAFATRSHTLGPTPGTLEAWHRGRARYAVWVLRIDDPAVLDRMSSVARGLGDAIEPVPSEHAHVTTFVAGFPTASEPAHDDDVCWRTLDAQVAALDRSARSPFPLQIGGANAFSSCAFLEVHDLARALARTRRELGALHPEVRFAPYTPHVTIGRFRDTRPVGPVLAALAEHREARRIEIAPAALELVTFDATHSGHAPLVTERTVRFRAP